MLEKISQIYFQFGINFTCKTKSCFNIFD